MPSQVVSGYTSINYWVNIYNLLFTLLLEKAFSQQTFNSYHPLRFAAGKAIIDNDSGDSVYHLAYSAACQNLNL